MHTLHSHTHMLVHLHAPASVSPLTTHVVTIATNDLKPDIGQTDYDT